MGARGLELRFKVLGFRVCIGVVSGLVQELPRVRDSRMDLRRLVEPLFNCLEGFIDQGQGPGCIFGATCG